MKKGLIVFDFDGTLVDTEAYLRPMFVERVGDVLGVADYAAADAETLRLYRKYGHTFKGLAIEQGFAEPEAWSAREYENIVDRFLARLPEVMAPCPATRKMVADLRDDDWELAVLSHSYRHYLEKVMTQVDLLDLFSPELVLGYDCVGKTFKQTPAPYEHLLSRLPQVPATKYMVEDMPENLQAARSLGFITALVGHDIPALDYSYIDGHYASLLAFGESLKAVQDPEAA